MAGAFGGDDEDFIPNDEEELDEEEMDEDDEDDEDDEEDEEEEEELEQKEDERVEEIKRQRQEIKDKTTLKISTKMIETLPAPIVKRGTFPAVKRLLGLEKKPKQKPSPNATENKQEAKQFMAKFIKAVGEFIARFAEVIFWVLIAVLIFLAVMILITAVATIIGSIFGALKGDDDEYPLGASLDGVTGKDFYGVRMLYKDNDVTRVKLLEGYVDVFMGSIDDIEKDTTITVNVLGSLPDDEYDYSTFDESVFSADYPSIYTGVNALADKMFEIDNPGETLPASLVEKLDGIKYFGLDSSVDLETLIRDYVNANYTFASVDGSVEQSEIDARVNTALTNYVANYEYVRVEKLIVKDHIFTNDDDSLKDVEMHDYVAYIFMPKRAGTFTEMTLMVRTETENEDLIIHIDNNGEILPYKQGVFYEDEIILYNYEHNQDISINAEPYNYVSLSENIVSTDTLYKNTATKSMFVLDAETNVYKINSPIMLKFTNPLGTIFDCVEIKTSYQ